MLEIKNESLEVCTKFEAEGRCGFASLKLEMGVMSSANGSDMRELPEAEEGAGGRGGGEGLGS